MHFIAKCGQIFEEAARQHDGADHNRRETPIFAESIARRVASLEPGPHPGPLPQAGRKRERARCPFSRSREKVADEVDR